MVDFGSTTKAAMISFGFAALILVPDAASAQPVCEFLGGAPADDQSLLAGPKTYFLRITSGQKCTGYYGTINSLRITRYKNVALEKAPQHGDVSLYSNASVSYRSKRNYKGPDEFTLEVCGEESGRNGCAMFTYKLTVD